MIALYRSTLLSSDEGDFFRWPNISLLLYVYLFYFLTIYCAHVSLESKCRPRYSAVGDCGITVLFMWTTRHCSFLGVKVTCTDFVALMLIRHFFSQASSWSLSMFCSLLTITKAEISAVDCFVEWQSLFCILIPLLYEYRHIVLAILVIHAEMLV
jgi:hypothetical protein